MPFDPQSDYPHPVPAGADRVRPDGTMWKENWVFPALDVEHRLASLFHFSLRPAHGEGIFTAKFNLGDRKHRYVGRSPIPTALERFRPVADERVRFEVVEPGRRFAISYRSDELDADLEYEGRFPAWDFGDGPEPHSFTFRHCEQGLWMTGELRWKGPDPLVARVAGYGNRDHSWGWRDDFQFRFHHWICASFPDRYVQGTLMRDTSHAHPKPGGWVSTAAGNTAVVAIDTGDPEWQSWEQGLPPLDGDVSYTLHLADGTTTRVTAHLGRDIGRHHLNFRAPDGSQAYEDCQVFCEYTLEDGGATGSGVLELGKHVEGAAVAGAVGRR